MWSEVDTSVAKDIVVDDFMATNLAQQFYGHWKDGRVTDRLIGQRFGYGVLGRFYSQRLWDQGCFAGMDEEEGDCAQGPQGTAVHMPEAPHDEPPPEMGQAEESANVAGAEQEEGDANEAASGTTGTEGSAAVSSRPSEVAGPSNSILTGSRQTSLAHWLL